MFSNVVCVHALKGLALPQAWSTGDVSSPGRSRAQQRQPFEHPLLSQKQQLVE
jgi:hypothetical protein